ncbi:MAG: NUDIX hydrolase [Longimicrobiales bacterium]
MLDPFQREGGTFRGTVLERLARSLPWLVRRLSKHLPIALNQLVSSRETTLVENATTRIAAYGLVLQQRQILLCRISSRVSRHAGSWTLPGGGIEFGEEPATAMVREVEEETGLMVRPGAVAGVDSLVLPDGESTTHSVRIIYFAEIVGGDLRSEVEGSTDLCAWHDIDATPKLPIVDLVERGLRFAGLG